MHYLAQLDLASIVTKARDLLYNFYYVYEYTQRKYPVNLLGSVFENIFFVLVLYCSDKV